MAFISHRGSQREEGMEIVSAAICAGIFNDLGSGSNVDLCIITKASAFLSILYDFSFPQSSASMQLGRFLDILIVMLV